MNDEQSQHCTAHLATIADRLNRLAEAQELANTLKLLDCSPRTLRRLAQILILQGSDREENESAINLIDAMLDERHALVANDEYKESLMPPEEDNDED